MRHEELVTAVTRLYTKESGRAGRDQLTRLLNAAGTKVSAPTVGAIMREHGLRAVRTQAWKKTTLQDPQAKTAHIENHMLDDEGKRDFTSAVPGTRLVGDITYLRTGEGWLYLATVIDLFSGMVIGWAMAEHMRASLCTAALRMARNHGHLVGGPVVFHSDRGTQGGFNRSSQHWIVEQILGTRPVLRPVSSSQAFSGVWCSGVWQRPGSLERSTETGRCPLGSIAAAGRSCSRSCRAARTVRVGEEDLYPGLDGEAGVIGEFLATIPGQ